MLCCSPSSPLETKVLGHGEGSGARGKARVRYLVVLNIEQCGVVELAGHLGVAVPPHGRAGVRAVDAQRLGGAPLPNPIGISIGFQWAECVSGAAVRQLVVFQSRPVSRLRYTQLGV
jgi:hypothetical protein